MNIGLGEVRGDHGCLAGSVADIDLDGERLTLVSQDAQVDKLPRVPIANEPGT